MADRSANAYLKLWGEAETKKIPMNGGTAVTGYKGVPLMLDASTDTTNAVVFTSSITAAAGDAFLGIAAAPFSIATTDSDGDVEVEAYIRGSIVGFPSAVFTLADVGETVWMDDSGTLTKTATANLKIGECFWVEGGYVYVRIFAPYQLVAADVT